VETGIISKKIIKIIKVKTRRKFANTCPLKGGRTPNSQPGHVAL
jgi:hypothetical protein